jgi:DNA-directed DNA polymerase III PolC
VEFGLLQQASQGLICLTGGLRSTSFLLAARKNKKYLREFLETLSAIFPGRLYVELQKSSESDEAASLLLAALAHQLHLPIVASHTVEYLFPEQFHLQKIVTAIRLNCPVTHLPPGAASIPGAFFRPMDELEAAFAKFPKALENTFEVAERCQGSPPINQPHFPILQDLGEQSPETVLRQKAFEGALQRYSTLTPGIQERLEHEIQAINKSGFASLFLMMQDIIQYAHQSGIPTASRGSASSSLVAYCLGITTPDPIRHNLYFERFLNPARKTPPDIDTDICSIRRDEILLYVVNRFGENRVAMVSTISRLRDRSALREVAKAYGLPAEQVSAMADALPWRWYGPRHKEEADDPYSSLKRRFHEPIHQEILRDAAALIGLPDHLSVHPGGMVISPVPIHEVAPTQIAPKGIQITQFDLDSIEHLGLVKIDLLGIRGLTVLGEVASRIKERSSFQPGSPAHPSQRTVNALDILEQIPETDPATSETVRTARTIGCFQIESPGMRATLREMQASSIEDILAALALFRPGPLTGGLKDAFVRRHLGLEEPQQIHPALTLLLSDTYGVILYQEQVLRIAHELAGLSLADADLLRRAMSHFDPGKEMITLRQRFIEGADKVSSIPPNVAARIWEMMAAFAGYGFPKAHAASYAVISWRAAWCKTHFPDLFLTAVLAAGGGYYRQRIYLNEARRLGLTLHPPHVNFARQSFRLVYLDGKPSLFLGLDQVRELTHRTQKRIMAGQPYRSFDDFLTRVDPRPIEAEYLVACGACEGFGSIPSLLEKVSSGWTAGQIPLFHLESLTKVDWTPEQKVAAQQEILGTGVDFHPLELVKDQLRGTINILEAASRLGETVQIAGLRQTIRKRYDAAGKPFYQMELEDLEGTIVVILNPELHRRFRSTVSSNDPFIVEGTLATGQEAPEPILVASRILPLAIPAHPGH